MAQIKFNRGLRDNLSGNTADDIAFISDSGTNWDSIYLGQLLVGTSLLGLMNPSKLKTKTSDSASSWTDVTIGTGSGNLSSVVITADMSGTSAITTCRKLVTATEAASDSYNPGDNEMLTAKAVKTIADASASAASVNTWYQNGSFSTSNWTWTATEQGGQGHGNLTFTLPVTSTFNGYTDDAHIPTTEAVTDWFAAFAGGMRYIGSLNSTTVPSGTKQGDVFIASAAITDLDAEEGDMIVVNDQYQSGTLSTSTCDVFERNIDGAVTTTDTLTSGKLIVGNGTKTITTLATTAGGLLYSSAANTVADLPIGTAGQHLVVSGGKPAWANTVYEVVTDGTAGDASFTVTPYENGVAQTVKTITIDNVANAGHATSADTATDATNADYVKMAENATTGTTGIPILVRGTVNSSKTGYYGVNYESQVTVTPSTNTLNATEVALTQSSTTINVFDTLTWHTLS